jgi:hypothetical protein
MAQIRIPHPWNPGYALPKYVKAEPDGRGAFSTRYIKRGTFFDAPKSMRDGAGYALPNYVRAEPVERGTFTTKYTPRRTVGALAPDMLQRAGALGSDDASDPIQMYGTRAAQIVLVEMGKVPAKDRPLMMKRILDGVDPALIAKVNARLKANKAKGMAQAPALRNALEESFREGITREFARIGKGRAAKKGPGALALGLDIGGSIKGLFSGHVKAAKKIGGVACNVARHPASGLAAGAGAAAYGANPEDAMTGAAVAANVCGGAYAPPPPAGAPWLPIALVGGAALIAVVLVTRD